MLTRLNTTEGAPSAPFDYETALAIDDTLRCLRQMSGWPSDKVLERDPKTLKPVTVADHRASCLQKLADLGYCVTPDPQPLH